MDLLDYCLKIRNLDTLLFYIIILIYIYIIRILSKYSIIRPILSIFTFVTFSWLGIANVFTLSGNPYLFQNVYPKKPNNFVGFISKNLINIVTIIGIMTTSIMVYNIKNRLVPALLLSVFQSIINLIFFKYILTELLLKIKNMEDQKFNIKRFYLGIMILVLVNILSYFLINFIINSNKI